MERFKRNPVGWGVALGAAIALTSLFLVWIEVVNRSGASERFRAISSFTGQSLMLVAVLALLAGFGIVISESWGRIVSAMLALLAGLMIAGAGVWALVDPEGLTQHSAEAKDFASLHSGVVQDPSGWLGRAFASGELTASARIGAIVGLVGGVLVLLGALLSFRRRATEVV